MNSLLRNPVYETCIQLQEVQGNEIFNIAPAQNNKSLSVFRDNFCEELSFPHLLPTGENGIGAEREV
jgi:hypothetical protein